MYTFRLRYYSILIGVQVAFVSLQILYFEWLLTKWYHRPFTYIKRRVSYPLDAFAMSTDVKRTRKPRERPANYTRPKKRQQTSPSDNNAPTRTPRQNLTLADWLTVYAFIDSHPDVSQSEVVRHFSTLRTGALIFEQSTLSRKLRDRAKMEARVNDNPAALSSKRPRIVTRPDVERALVLWVQHMEGEGQTVSGPMLREKRKQFEDEFEVPERERLFGDGWLHSFRKTYRVHENSGRGEADSVEPVVGVNNETPQVSPL